MGITIDKILGDALMHDHVSADISDLTTTLDPRYVNVTGDTMTGDLNFNKTDSTSLVTGDSSSFTGSIGSWVYWYGAGVTLTATGGKGVMFGGSAGGGYYLPVATMLAGRRFTCTFKARLASGASGNVSLASGATGTITATATEATYSITFTSTGTTLGVIITTGATIEFDDFNLYETSLGDITTNGFFKPYGASTGLKGLNASGDLYFGSLLTTDLTAGVNGTYATAGTKLMLYGAGDSTNGLLSVHSASTNARGTLARFGYYSFWNMDSAGNTYWNWGARYNGTTNAWVRDYTNANNYLPYITYGTSSNIAIGGATSNDKTALTPTMATKFNFDVTATDPLQTNSGRLFIDGVADAIQLRVQAHSSQTTNLQTWENSSGTVLGGVAGDGRMGIGTTPIASNKLYVYSSVNDSGSYNNLTSDISVTTTTNTNNSYNALNFSANKIGTHNIGFLRGVIGSVYHSGTGGTTASMQALYTNVGLLGASSAGAISNTYHLVVSQLNRAVGSTTTVGNAYGINISNQGGTYVTSAYGIYMGDQSGATNNYAILTNAGNIVFNEGGDASTDFRVESDTEANMLFLDANADTDGAIYLGGTTNGIKISKEDRIPPMNP